mgnify:CR=1 FL=1
MKSISENKTYKIYIKDAIEIFTKKLYYALFLDKKLQHEELKEVKQHFLSIAKELEIEKSDFF